MIARSPVARVILGAGPTVITILPETKVAVPVGKSVNVIDPTVTPPPSPPITKVVPLSTIVEGNGPRVYDDPSITTTSGVDKVGGVVIVLSAVPLLEVTGGAGKLPRVRVSPFRVITVSALPVIVGSAIVEDPIMIPVGPITKV
jgi:hypothetical protein